MDARRMGEGVAAHDGLVGLHGHVHQARHQVRGLGDQARIDVRVDGHVLVAAERHHHLVERGVAGPFADAVDRDLGLPCAVQDAAQRIGRSHAQIVVAVGRNDRPVDVGNVVHEVFDLRAVFVRKTVARRVGDIDHRRAGPDDRLDHAGEVLDVGAPGVLGIELHVLDVAFGIFHRLDGRFDDLLGRGTQFVVDMLRRNADARMDTLAPGQPQRIGRNVDVLLHGAGQRADRRLGNGLGNLQHGVEITGAGDGKSRLDDVYAEAFEQFGDFNFFGGVQLTTGDLLTVAQRGVENVQSLTHTNLFIE